MGCSIRPSITSALSTAQISHESREQLLRISAELQPKAESRTSDSRAVNHSPRRIPEALGITSLRLLCRHVNSESGT